MRMPNRLKQELHVPQNHDDMTSLTHLHVHVHVIVMHMHKYSCTVSALYIQSTGINVGEYVPKGLIGNQKS